jgi:hypothetical protein
LMWAMIWRRAHEYDTMCTKKWFSGHRRSLYMALTSFPYQMVHQWWNCRYPTLQDRLYNQHNIFRYWDRLSSRFTFSDGHTECRFGRTEDVVQDLEDLFVSERDDLDWHTCNELGSEATLVSQKVRWVLRWG